MTNPTERSPSGDTQVRARRGTTNTNIGGCSGVIPYWALTSVRLVTSWGRYSVSSTLKEPVRPSEELSLHKKGRQNKVAHHGPHVSTGCSVSLCGAGDSLSEEGLEHNLQAITSKV